MLEGIDSMTYTITKIHGHGKMSICVLCDPVIRLGIVLMGSTPGEPTGAEFIGNYLHSFR